MSTLVMSAVVFASLNTGAMSATPTPEEVVSAAAFLGIDARSMASAGIVGAEVATLLDRLELDYADYEAYLGDLGSVADAHDDLFGARAACRLDPADQAALTAFNHATSTLATAESDAASKRSALISAICDALATTQEIQDALIDPDLKAVTDPAYRHACDTAEEARRLSWALRLRDRLGGSEDLPPQAAAEINAAESLVAVQTAIQAVTTHATPNQLAISQWIATQ